MIFSEELFEKVKDKVRSEYEETISSLKKEWETENSLKYALQREMEHLRSHYEEQLENAKLQVTCFMKYFLRLFYQMKKVLSLSYFQM